MVPTARRITLFNHKGGVGKTTLTFHIAAALVELGKRVLLVDADPQCNLTSQLIEDSVVDDLLDTSDRKGGRTLWTAIRDVHRGIGDVVSVPSVEVNIRSTLATPGRLHVVPGDLRLAEFESFLYQQWINAFQRQLSGHRGLTAISRTIDLLTSDDPFDFIFYDIGPNVGPLNRVVLLDTDYFIIPVACELFSLRALETLGVSLSNWITDWRTIATIAPEDAPLLRAKPCFLGYIPQRFRQYADEPATSQAEFLPRLERGMHADVATVLRRLDPALVHPDAATAPLGKVKDYASLVAESQRDGVPIWTLSRPNAPPARDVFRSIARRVLNRVGGDAEK